MLFGALTTNASPESNAYGANRIVGSGCDLSGAPGAVSIAIDQIVPRHRVLVVAVDVVTRLRVLKRKSASFEIHMLRDRRNSYQRFRLAIGTNRRKRFYLHQLLMKMKRAWSGRVSKSNEHGMYREVVSEKLRKRNFCSLEFMSEQDGS